MFREEHFAHPAGSNLIEDAVRTEFETLVPALEDEPCLERREDAGLDEPRGGVGRGRRDRSGTSHDAGEYVVVRDLGAAHEREDRIASEREVGHVQTP